MTKVTNDPFEKRRITYSHVWWDGAFSNEELDRLEQYCLNLKLDNGKTVGPTEDFRNSKINFVKRDNDNVWIFEKFNGVINELNDLYYNFNLYGYDSFQYTTYDAIEMGKYDWHMDLTLGRDLQETMHSESTRKLSLVMLLNRPEIDFTGGEFQINTGAEQAAETLDLVRGKIYAFPSFIPHRVKPVLTGIRKSIVIWVEGPKFV